MSKEKQELFRLNLLAAGSAEGNLRVIHLLLPEGAEDASIWKTASAALGAINGSGGLENSLYAVVPKTYRPGQLDHTLGKLSKEEGDGVHHSFLVFGGEQEKLSENSPENVTFYSASEVAGRKTVPEIAQSEPLSKLFGLDIQSLSEPTVWAVPGPIPDGGLESQTPIDKLPDASAMAEMLTQASNAGGRLVLLASQAGAAKEIPGQGELLLLSTSAAELPALGPNLKGSALALTSPFETSSPKWLALRPSSQLSPRQARLFDALALSAAPQGSGIDGLTIRRTPEGEYKAKVPTKYQWTNGSWLPELEEKSKNE